MIEFKEMKIMSIPEKLRRQGYNGCLWTYSYIKHTYLPRSEIS